MIKLKLKYLLTISFSCFTTIGLSQSFEAPETRDSLVELVNNPTTHDTVVAKNCYFLGHWYLYQQPDSAEYYALRGLEISTTIDHVMGIAAGYSFLSYFNKSKGNLSAAVDYNLKSLALYEKNGLSMDGRYTVVYNNLASLHTEMGNYEKTIYYLKKSLKINGKHVKRAGMAGAHSNMAFAYTQLGQFEESMDAYREAIRINKANEEPNQLPFCYIGMADNYMKLGIKDSALLYYQTALDMSVELQLQLNIATSKRKLGTISYQDGDLSKANQMVLQAYQISDEYNYVKEKSKSAQVLYNIFKAQNQANKALYYYEVYNTINDSLNSSENQQAIIRGEYEFEYDKKRIVDSLEQEKVLVQNELLNQENKVKKEQLSVQRLWLALSIGLLVMFAAIVFFARKNTRLKMHNLRSEVRLRLVEVNSLKNEIKLQSEAPQQDNNLNLVLQEALSSREQEVLDQIVLGASNKEIAEKLFLSVNTIKTHVNSLYVKLDVSNRTQAAVKASRLSDSLNK